MEQERRSPERLRELAEKVVRLILEDQALARELGCGSAVPKQECPRDHQCDGNFRCSLPFKCPNGHEDVAVIAKQECPRDHECDGRFSCSLPFKCPHGHEDTLIGSLETGSRE
jgi:hypothetical protein